MYVSRLIPRAITIRDYGRSDEFLDRSGLILYIALWSKIRNLVGFDEERVEKWGWRKRWWTQRVGEEEELGQRHRSV